MVEKVTAYRGEDGRLYPSQIEAENAGAAKSFRELMPTWPRAAEFGDALRTLEKIAEHPDWKIYYKGGEILSVPGSAEDEGGRGD